MLDTSFESNQEDRPLSQLAKYPQIDERLVKICWHKDWWDGPVDGCIVYGGARYWFSFWCDTDAPRNPYYYFIYPLSDQESAIADAWSKKNEEFAKKWRPLANDPAMKDSEEVKAVGTKWRVHFETLPDFTQREPVGWFCSGSNSSFYAVEVKPAF